MAEWISDRGGRRNPPDFREEAPVKKDAAGQEEADREEPRPFGDGGGQHPGD